MRLYTSEPGVLLDSLIFLSECNGGCFSAGENPRYDLISSKLKENKLEISCCLSPLTASFGKNPSFLHTVLFDEIKYSLCSISKSTQIVENTAYMKNRFIEFYLPGLNHSDNRKVAEMNYPDAIKLIDKAQLPSDQKIYFIHAVVNFEKLLQDLLKMFRFIHNEITVLHNHFTIRNQNILKDLENGNDVDRLLAISRAQERRREFRYSISLFDTGRISFRPDEPAFFILGSEFHEILETKYKYKHLTPISFARDLGNEAKRSIYKALLKRTSMSTAEMEGELHLSRNAVSRNIKEMRECGIVEIERIEGLSYYYKLNRDYLDTVSMLLSQPENTKKAL